jgi:hypothetical protein
MIVFFEICDKSRKNLINLKVFLGFLLKNLINSEDKFQMKKLGNTLIIK